MARGQTEIKQALAQLSDVAHDMSKMLAVHENRLDTHERAADELKRDIEARRSDLDKVVKDIGDSIDKKTGEISEKIEKHVKNSADQHHSLSGRISKVERYVWMAVGAVSIASFLIQLILKLIPLAH